MDPAIRIPFEDLWVASSRKMEDCSEKRFDYKTSDIIPEKMKDILKSFEDKQRKEVNIPSK